MHINKESRYERMQTQYFYSGLAQSQPMSILLKFQSSEGSTINKTYQVKASKLSNLDYDSNKPLEFLQEIPQS